MVELQIGNLRLDPATHKGSDVPSGAVAVSLPLAPCSSTPCAHQKPYSSGQYGSGRKLPQRCIQRQIYPWRCCCFAGTPGRQSPLLPPVLFLYLILQILVCLGMEKGIPIDRFLHFPPLFLPTYTNLTLRANCRTVLLFLITLLEAFFSPAR